MLAAEDPAWVMSLLDPSLRFSSIRAVETVHVFKNGKRTEEGIQRVQAQKLVTDGEQPPNDWKHYGRFSGEVSTPWSSPPRRTLPSRGCSRTRAVAGGSPKRRRGTS